MTAGRYYAIAVPLLLGLIAAGRRRELAYDEPADQRWIDEYCETCGGDGGWSIETSFLSGHIHYTDITCHRCGGEKHWLVPLEPIEEEDLAIMSGEEP